MDKRKVKEFFDLLEYEINMDETSAGIGEGGVLEVSFSAEDKHFDLFLNLDGTWSWQSFPKKEN